MNNENNQPLYSLTEQNMKLFNKCSGIYGLVYQNEIIYVGQSHNICRRLHDHMKESAIQTTINKIYKEDGKHNRSKELAKYIFIDKHREDMEFTILQITDNLDEWEEHYITLLQPKYNYVGVDIPYRRAS